jgi:hypothetical protein
MLNTPALELCSHLAETVGRLDVGWIETMQARGAAAVLTVMIKRKAPSLRRSKFE